MISLNLGAAVITLQPRFIQYMSHVDLAYASNITSIFSVFSLILVLAASLAVDKFILQFSSPVVRKMSLVLFAFFGVISGVLLVNYPCQVTSNIETK